MKEGIAGEGKNKVILGDCYEEIKGIGTGTIDLIVTDPPYEIAKSTSGKGIISEALIKLTDELANKKLNIGIDCSILDEFMRVMKKPNIYIWCNKKQIPKYLEYFVVDHRCAFEVLVWIKSNPVPTCGRNYLNDKEFCLYFRKGVALRTSYHSAKTYWITPTNVKDKKKYGHPTIKPAEIIETLISNSSREGEMVLDCFAGSGTTAACAKKLKRNYIAIEYDEGFYKTILRRIGEIN